MPVTDLMSDTLVTIKPEGTIERALRVMAMHQVRRLPVIDNTKHLVGVIALADIVRSDAVAPKTLALPLRKIMAPPRVSCVNRSLLLKTCAEYRESKGKIPWRVLCQPLLYCSNRRSRPLPG
jgi:CBS-domain-containing membrane protein